MSAPFVVGITGASGSRFAQRLVEVLLQSKQRVHLAISTAGTQVIRQELHVDWKWDPPDPSVLWSSELCEHLSVWQNDNFFSPIASGSSLTSGMVVCPCSGGTLSAIANGSDQNLIQRAASVHLKERRKLILVPRETPLSLPMIENMRRAHLAGATILPAMPGWYNSPSTLSDLIDFVVARILDQLDVQHDLGRRWGQGDSSC